MKLSYLITAKDETDSLDKLLCLLTSVKNLPGPEQEIILLIDSSSDTPYKTKKIIGQYANQLKMHYHPLNNDFGSHKTYGIQQTSGEFIMQLDADELPSRIYHRGKFVCHHYRESRS